MKNKGNKSQGFIFVWRSLKESDVWFMPPEYLKLWVYLLIETNHQKARYRGFTVNRGQCFRSYQEIAEAVSYFKGSCRVPVTRDQVKRMMHYFKKQKMITTKKEPRGVLITIINYEKYQQSTTHGGNQEAHQDSPAVKLKKPQGKPSINNNDNKKKNDQKGLGVEFRNETIKELSKPNYEISDPEAYIVKLERTTSPEAIRKAWKDWRNGHFSSPSELYARAKFYHKES